MPKAPAIRRVENQCDSKEQINGTPKIPILFQYISHHVQVGAVDPSLIRI